MIPKSVVSRVSIAALALGSAIPFGNLLAQEESKDFRDFIEVNPNEVSREGGLMKSYADVVEKVKPAVVSIYATQKGKKVDLEELPPAMRDPFFRRFFGEDAPEKMPDQNGIGSGFIVSSEGHILTNNHVVEGADELRVLISSIGKEFEAEVIGTDPNTDVAVIKVKADQDLPTLEIADSDQARVGDVVLAVGSPLGFDQTVTMGIVSALGRSEVNILGRDGYADFIQTDASINQGNSGGPLVDIDGRVIGINTAIYSGTGHNIGIGFSVPSNLALKVATDLFDDGKVDRGYLGVALQSLDQTMAEQFGLENSKGALVGQVAPNTPAKKAGIKDGDIITAIDGKEVEDSSRLRLIVSGTSPGTSVEFKVWRDGKFQKIKVKLGKLPSDLASAFDSGRFPQQGEEEGVEGPVDAEILSGVRVGELSAAFIEEHNLREDTKGVAVMSVELDSPAAKVGVQAGDVIVEVARKPVGSVDELSKRIANAGDRVLLRVETQGRARYLVMDL